MSTEKTSPSSLPLPLSSPAQSSQKRKKALKLASAAALCLLAGSAFNNAGDAISLSGQVLSEGVQAGGEAWGWKRVRQGVEGLFKHKVRLTALQRAFGVLIMLSID